MVSKRTCKSQRIQTPSSSNKTRSLNLNLTARLLSSTNKRKMSASSKLNEFVSWSKWLQLLKKKMKVWSQSLKKIKLSITKKWSSYKCNLTKNATNVKMKSEIMIGCLDQSSLLNESLLLAKKKPLSSWMNWSLNFRRNAKISNQVSTSKFL
jgi:hypothetical protein